MVGSGSNLLVADEGFRGLAIKLDGELAAIERDGERMLCGGGARLPSAAAKAAGWGLSGLEFGINIPGTAGGAVRMNANAYGGQLAEVLEWVDVCTAAGTERRLPEQLGFAYRSSNLGPAEVVARASFRSRPPTRPTIKATLAGMRERRREAQPSGIKTFGSTFKNPEDPRAGGRTAGQLLEAAGCRGLRVGGARFSEKHANFVENDGRGDHRRRAGADGRGSPPGPRALRRSSSSPRSRCSARCAGPAAGSCEAASASVSGLARRAQRGWSPCWPAYVVLAAARLRVRRSATSIVPRSLDPPTSVIGTGDDAVGVSADGDAARRQPRARRTERCRGCRCPKRRRAAVSAARCSSRPGRSGPRRRRSAPASKAAATAKAGWT